MEAGSRTRDVMPLRWRIASHAHLVALGEPLASQLLRVGIE